MNHPGPQIKKCLAAFLATLFVATSSGTVLTAEEPLAVDPQVTLLQRSFAKVAARIKPATVNIIATQVESYQVQPFQFFYGDPFQDFFGDPFSQRGRRQPQQRQRQTQGMGSGVVVDPRGYVLTNAHVVRKATKIEVRLLDPHEKTYEGKLVGIDSQSDLAVVKINSPESFTFAQLADSDKTRVGDWVVAVGSPFGLEQTVTAGIISAVRQSLNIEGSEHEGLLQTDAAINRGNSGGPLVNIKGEVVGINTAIYAPTGVFSGIGFAIPSNRARTIMEQLMSEGRVVRGWMGVEIAPLNEVLARQFRVSDKKGVLVNRVFSNSPAAKAGLLRGDVIRSFDGQKIVSPESLKKVVSRTKPNKTVPVRVIRDGSYLDVTLITGEKPTEQARSPQSDLAEATENETLSQWEWEGGLFMELNEALAQRYQIRKEVPGVTAVRIEPGSLMEEAGILEGDIIASVNRHATPDLQNLQQASRKVRWSRGVVFDVSRRGKWIYISYAKNN